MTQAKCGIRNAGCGIIRRRSGLLVGIVIALVAGCDGVPAGSKQRNDLASMRQVTISIPGKASYKVYVAKGPEEQQLGLMNITERDLPADHGMIFVFTEDAYRSFWMRNTIIPLDIAYIRSDGSIVRTVTMAPLDERGYPSIAPARFALEVRAGQFAEKGIRTGDHVEIPVELFD